MKNKKSVMAVSALLILVFHLWITTSQSSVELFFKQTAFVGVDMFFFLSAFSLGSRKIDNYGAFVFSRFRSVYLKYILFSVLAFFVLKWSFARLIQVILGIELFTKGGGAFLWFLPAIMLFYILFPFLQRADEKNRSLALIITVLLWMAVSFVVTAFTGYTKMFIFTNRIPVFLLGFYFASTDSLKKVFNKKSVQLLTGIALLLAGIFIAVKFAFKVRLSVPFTDMFYVTVIPLALGLILLTSLIKEVKVISWIGSSTLEMYAIQMIFGYKITNKLIKVIPNSLVVTLLACASVIVISVAVHYLYSYAEKKIRSKLK